MHARFEGAREDVCPAAFVKKPLSNNTADRIQQQTLANMKNLYEGKVKVAEEETQRILEQRKLEAKETEALFEALLDKVDMLAKFLMQHHEGELTDEILELIADRQEARIESTMGSGGGSAAPGFGGLDLADTDAVTVVLTNTNIGPVAGSVLGRSASSTGAMTGHSLSGIGPSSSDGQVLRRDVDGNVVWTDPNLTTPKSLADVKEQVRRLVTRLKE